MNYLIKKNQNINVESNKTNHINLTATTNNNNNPQQLNGKFTNIQWKAFALKKAPINNDNLNKNINKIESTKSLLNYINNNNNLKKNNQILKKFNENENQRYNKLLKLNLLKKNFKGLQFFFCFFFILKI